MEDLEPGPCAGGGGGSSQLEVKELLKENPAGEAAKETTPVAKP